MHYQPWLPLTTYFWAIIIINPQLSPLSSTNSTITIITTTTTTTTTNYTLLLTHHHHCSFKTQTPHPTRTAPGLTGRCGPSSPWAPPSTCRRHCPVDGCWASPEVCKLAEKTNLLPPMLPRSILDLLHSTFQGFLLSCSLQDAGDFGNMAATGKWYADSSCPKVAWKLSLSLSLFLSFSSILTSLPSDNRPQTSCRPKCTDKTVALLCLKGFET